MCDDTAGQLSQRDDFLLFSLFISCPADEQHLQGLRRSAQLWARDELCWSSASQLLSFAPPMHQACLICSMGRPDAPLGALSEYYAIPASMRNDSLHWQLVRRSLVLGWHAAYLHAAIMTPRVSALDCI